MQDQAMYNISRVIFHCLCLNFSEKLDRMSHSRQTNRWINIDRHTAYLLYIVHNLLA